MKFDPKLEEKWSRATRLFEKWPLIGGLSDTPWSVMKDVMKELFCVFLLSLTPLIFVAVMLTAKHAEGPSFFDHIWNNLKAGDIYIYTNSLLAPVGYMLYRFYRDQKRCPSFLSILFCMPLIQLTSAILYTLEKSNDLGNLQFAGNLAATLFALAVLIRIVTMTHSRNGFDFQGESRRQEVDFTKAASEAYKH